MNTDRLTRGMHVAVFASLIAAAIAGCGSNAQLVNLWQDQEFTKKPMSSVLVMAMARDPVRRRMWEDSFANELERHGVKATPSYRLFPDALPDTEKVVETVKQEGYDGVIVTKMLPSETRTDYVPGYVTTVPVTRYSRWRSGYVTYYQDVYNPGYVETEKVVRHRTDVWSTDEDGHLVWSGTTEVFDPTSAQSVNEEVTKRIVPELAKQGIIPRT
jgi:hypothetical protein